MQCVEGGAGDERSALVEDIVDEFAGARPGFIGHDEEPSFLVGAKGVERVPEFRGIDLLGEVRRPNPRRASSIIMAIFLDGLELALAIDFPSEKNHNETK
jgi:hypothetical protein